MPAALLPGRVSSQAVRVPFSVDIGVGDIIVPGTTACTMQTQLDGFDAPEILTYSLESTVAEKLDAILQRFELTSRMKDFYDIYYLSRTFDFEGEKLKTALQKTLQNRGTPFGEDSFARGLYAGFLRPLYRRNAAGQRQPDAGIHLRPRRGGQSARIAH